MAAVKVGCDHRFGKEEWIGLTADTTAFIAANTTMAPGSTYREVDGAKRKYEFLNGTWYQQ